MNMTRPPGRAPDRGVKADKSIRVAMTPDEYDFVDSQRKQEPRASWVRRRALARTVTLADLRPLLDRYIAVVAKAREIPPETVSYEDLERHFSEDIRGSVLAIARAADMGPAPIRDPE